jgi:NADH:ubiquinone oxidoreductase subunit F (NADH-binding)/ferredoxin
VNLAQVPPVTSIGVPRLTAGMDEFGRLDLRAHREVHGNVQPLSLRDLMELANGMKLKGRGGAGFPFAKKVQAVIESCRRRDLPPIIVVNATEGEPAAWKDKVLLTRAPHLILDGAALAAAALDAEEIVVGVADDGIGFDSLDEALMERRMPVPTRIVTVPHRFISGEGGALVRGINGEVHIPPGVKTRASDTGVAGLPTLLSNAETFAQIAIGARIGPYEYSAVGDEREPGTVMLTVLGSARHPAVVECPTGTPLKEVLRLCGAGLGPGVLTGGFHGKWMTSEAAGQAEVSRESFNENGGSLGAGIIIPLGDDTCPLGETKQVLQYLAGESAGQCGPCRLGLPDLARVFGLIASGGGSPDAVRAAAGFVKGRGACSHPDGTARFALSALETFAEDIAAHSHGDGCGKPVRGVLPLPPYATARRLSVDWTRCDGHGLCAVVAPELISLDANGFPAFPDAPVPGWLEAGARKAVSMCPELALRLTVPPKAPGHGGEERGGLLRRRR